MTESTITLTLAAWLETNRPAALSATVAIAADSATAILEAPYLIVSIDGLERPHPLILQGDLLISIYTQADDTTQTAADAWAAAVETLVSASFDAIKATLLPLSIILKKLRPTGQSCGPAGDRARAHRITYAIEVQTGTPS